MELKIEYLPVESLRPYDRNARKHSEKDVRAIVKSIEEFGFDDPIGIWGDNLIVEGHGRLLAAQELGMGTVPCIRLDHLTDEQRRAYALAHNRTAELSSWDDVLQELELSSITEIDMEQFGFSIVEEQTQVDEDDYDVDEDVEPVAKRGQIFQLGNHRLMCGDSTSAEDVQALMDGGKAQFVFTDPPWNVDYGAQENPKWKQRKILNDSMSTEDFKDFMNSAFARLNESCEEGAMVYVVMSAQEWGNLMLTLKDNGFHWSSTIIWNKDRLVLSRKDYHTKYEPIWYGWKDGSRLHPLKDRKQSDVWDIERPKRSDEHPTMKPVSLVARAINNSCKRGDVVLDLFGGSGTTLIAAEQTERMCRMMELDPHYCDVIINRWEELTGEKAVLLNG